MTDISADLLAEILDEVRSDSSGEIAPHLGDYEHPTPDAFALAVCDLDGEVISAGDDEVLFDLQSASKPFVYALALDQKGVDEVAKRIGVEPSGDPFNEISLEAGTGRAPNALVNAGALAAHAVVGDEDDDEDSRFEQIREMFSRLVGREVEVDAEIIDIESRRAHRNQALAHLLAEEGIDAGVVKLNRISPLDAGTLAVLADTDCLLVAEDSFGAGCVGQRVEALLAEGGQAPERLILKNLGETYAPEGTVAELEHSFGLDAAGIAAAVREVRRHEQ